MEGQQVAALNNDNGGSGNVRRPVTDGSSYYTQTTTRMEQLHFVNKWAVEQFSVQQELCPPGESIDGCVFGSGPYKFQMRLFPSGKDEECNGFVSLYLLIKECPGTRVSFRVSFALDTLDGPRGCSLNKSVVTINRGGIVTASKFFSLETLKTRGCRFLPNDSLVVSVELVVFGELRNSKNDMDMSDLEEEAPENTTSSSGSSRESLGSRPFFLVERKRKSVANELSQLGKPVPEDEYDGGFAALWQCGELTDFIIECSDGNQLKVHRAVLFARSGYFQGIFRTSCSEKEKSKVVIKDLEPDVVEAVINYMYTLNCPQLLTIPARIARAADRFLMPGLKSRCENILSLDFTDYNVPERLQISYELNMERLLRKAVAYFARNRDAVCATEEWKTVKQGDPDLVSRVMEDAWKLAEKQRYPSVKRRRPSEDS